MPLDLGSIRVRGRRISGNTGGYSRARERLPLELAERVTDKIAAAIIDCHKGRGAQKRRVFVIDGSTITVPHTEENLGGYPQYKNQHGKSHFPLVRLGFATDAWTGVSLRPAYGPYSGSKAIGELTLAEDLYGRLPGNSILIGDRYYGVARFAHSAKVAGHDVVCRIKERSAKKFIGSPSSGSGEVTATWDSKRSTTGEHYQVQGRFIWYHLRRRGFRPQLLVFFTTLNLPIKEIVELYGLRWNVELDLRTLKSTLEMGMLKVKSPEMIVKEIVLGVSAYNLIRHITTATARMLKVSPREISFSRVLNRVNAAAKAKSENLDRSLQCLMLDLNSLKLPKRKTRRPTEPRKAPPNSLTETV